MSWNHVRSTRRALIGWGAPLVLLIAGGLLGCASGPSTRAPALDPPPAAERRLDREAVVAEAKARDPDAAIAHLDRYPFEFELSEELEWLRAQELAPEVLDYLEKRSRVDWEALRGDIDPEGGRDSADEPR